MGGGERRHRRVHHRHLRAPAGAALSGRNGRSVILAGVPDYDEVVESQIREAMARGDFDDLPGTGKRLDLGDDEPGWWARRKVQEMRTRDRLLEAARQIEAERERLWVLADESEVREQLAALNRELEIVNEQLPAADHLAPLPAEQAVRIWRSMHRLRQR